MERFEWRLQLMISAAAETALLPLAAHLLPLATAVCTSTSKSKQTHIHVTGQNRYFFFNSHDIEGNKEVEKKQTIILSKSNIATLLTKEKQTSIKLVESFTMLKVAHRANQDTQVQISKIRQDGTDFIELRNALFESDLLIFLQYRHSENMFAVAVPSAYYKGRYSFSDDIFSGLESRNAVSVKRALETVKNNYSDEDIVEGEETIVDSIYQSQVDTATPSVTVDEPIIFVNRNPNGKDVKSYRPSTNASFGKEAIRDNGFKCATDITHEIFISKTGVPYLEAHHLIPLSHQCDFKNSLDVKANIIPLCPLCHSKIHHSDMATITPMLKAFYDERSERLKDCGIEITFDELLDFYR